MRGFAAWCAGIALAGAAAQGALVLAQEGMLRTRIAAILGAPAETVPVTDEPRAGGQVLLRVAVPPAYRDLLHGPFGSPVPVAVIHTNFHTVRAAADRLLIKVGGPQCDPARLTLRLAYALRPEAWQPKTRDMTLARPAGGWEAPLTLVVPAFYRASQHFEGIELAAADRSCIRAIRRAEDEHRLPIIFSAVLATGWEMRPLRLRFVSRLGPTPPR